MKRQITRKAIASADGGLESANLIARGELMVSVMRAIEDKGWTQAQAAEFLGVAQPRISDVAKGKIDRFSVDMLMTWLEKLGKDVSVQVRENVFSSETMVQLVLYVCGEPADQILGNVERLFGGRQDKFALRIVDVLQHPEIASEQRIVSVPCLVKESPLPRIVLTGDLSSASVRWQLSIADRTRLDAKQDELDAQESAQNKRERALDARERELDRSV